MYLVKLRGKGQWIGGGGIALYFGCNTLILQFLELRVLLIRDPL
jgi:hypothetical protein